MAKPVHLSILVGSLFILTVTTQIVDGLSKVIFGVNAGGDSHVDIHGIKFQKDPLEGRVGIASDYGRQYLTIRRVADVDAILYQTERYHTANFGYDIPISEDGDYVLVLKFCEVYFNSPGMKVRWQFLFWNSTGCFFSYLIPLFDFQVFDVTFNGVHTIVSYLDIFEKVGKAVAHDEYIPFRISKGKVLVNDEESELLGKKIKVEFIKVSVSESPNNCLSIFYANSHVYFLQGSQDNPKINALYVIKGTMEGMS